MYKNTINLSVCETFTTWSYVSDNNNPDRVFLQRLSRVRIASTGRLFLRRLHILSTTSHANALCVL